MGICKYCGKSAGFFNKKHSECEQTFNEGIKLLNDYTSAFFLNEEPIDIFRQRITTLAENYYLDESRLILNIIECWGNSIKSILNDSKINENALNKLFIFQNVFILQNHTGLEKAFGKINLEIGKKYKIYDEGYELLHISDNIIMSKDSNGKFKWDRQPAALFKYYENIEELTEKAILDLFNFKESFLNNFLKLDFIREVELETIKEKVEHYKNLFFDSDLKHYINVNFINYIIYLREKVSISDLNESYLSKIQSELEIKKDDINKEGDYSKLVQQFIIKDIEAGKFPERVNVEDEIPFNLQKNEKVIWLSNSVELFGEKVSRHYEGGHLGMSFRVANGMYLRAGEFKGRPVETINTTFITRGIVGYTNKHMYFFSYKKSFKIRYDKIISIVPHSNGIIIMTEGISSKPIILKNEDGVFVYNLITSLTKSEIAISSASS